MDWLSLIGIAVFIILGVAIIMFIAKIIWFLLPAAIVALVVFFLTSYNLYWTGVAFVVVAILSLVLKLRK